MWAPSCRTEPAPRMLGPSVFPCSLPMTLSCRRLSAVLVALAVAACSSSGSRPEEAAPVAAVATTAVAASAPYTEAQAERGLEVFRDVCVECHYRSDFRGTQFQFEWRRRTVRDFYKTIVETMPEENPGELESQQYIDVVTFLLSLNGFPAGDTELVGDEDALRSFSMAAPGN